MPFNAQGKTIHKAKFCYFFFKFSPGNKKNYLSKKAYPNNVTSHYDDYLDVVSKVNVNIGRVGGYLANPEVSHQKEFFHSIIEKWEEKNNNLKHFKVSCHR